MQFHQLHSIHKGKNKKRIGRGGKKGTYCGKGLKGQKSRAGARFKPLIRSLIKKYHKLRGYKFKSKAKNQKSKVGILNLDVLEKKFASGEKITPEALIEKGIVCKIGGRTPQIKILGKGEIKKKLIIENCQISKGAKEKIEKASGTVKT